MKAKLQFNLPEEETEFKLAMRGEDYFSFLWDLHQDIRSWLKYGHNFKTPEEVLEEIQARLQDVPIWDI